MLRAIKGVAKTDRVEAFAIGRVQRCFDTSLKEAVIFPAPCDQVGNGADLEVMKLCERDEVRQTGHRAVFVHDFADDARRIEARHAGNVDGSFGVPGPHHSATILGNQREDMARRNDIVIVCGRVDRHGNGACAVMCGNAGRHAFFRFNRNGEGRLHAFTIVARHHVEVKRVGTLLRHGEANQAATIPGHEVDLFRGRKSRRNNQVTLVFAVLSVDENVHLAVAGILNDLVDRGNRVMEVIRHYGGVLLARRRLSCAPHSVPTYRSQGLHGRQVSALTAWSRPTCGG